MSLNKFIPLSPDPNITRDSDMGMAQFGHLNTIIDYLNSALNISKYNIIITKLNQTNPATFPIQKQDTVSIGTNYTPTANPLQTGDGNTFVGINSAMGDDNSYFNTMIGYAASITAVQPKNVVIGAQATSGSAEVVAIGHLASSSASAGIAIGAQASVTGSQGIAIGRTARTTTANGFALGNASALLQIGGNFVPTARVHVKGLGATSATTSLLVENSSGIESLKIQDDNIVRTTYLGIGGGTSTNNIGGTTIAQFGNAVSSGDQLIVVDSSAGTKRGFKFGNQGTIRMALIQDGVNLQIGNFVSTFNPYVTFEYTTGNVGFGTTSTNASAKVQIDSITQGLLKPRMTTTQKNAIVTPAAGLEVFDTTLGRPCFYSGSAWVTL
jgi:hypothetical protein